MAFAADHIAGKEIRHIRAHLDDLSDELMANRQWRLDPILDACVATYNADLDEDGQVNFKGKAKVFCRTYSFLSAVLPYSKAEWEKLSILLNLLTPKLPAFDETASVK